MDVRLNSWDSARPPPHRGRTGARVGKRTGLKTRGGSMRRQRFHEAAHKVELGPAAQSTGDLRTATRPAKTRIYNEAAHKLGYRGPAATATAEREPEGVRRRLAALSDSDRDVVADAG